MLENTEDKFNGLDFDKKSGGAGEVAELLREMIGRGELIPGERLPPERDLAKLLGVSRPTLRTGLRSLAAVGILHSRQGAGTFVAKTEETPSFDSAPLRLMAALMQFSSDEVSETEILLAENVARLAAVRAGAPQRRQLAEALARLEDAVDDAPRFAKYEARLQKILAGAAQNRLLGALLKMVDETAPDKSSEDLARLAALWRALYAAVRGRDAEAAATAMRALLREKRAEILTGAD